MAWQPWTLSPKTVRMRGAKRWHFRTSVWVFEGDAGFLLLSKAMTEVSQMTGARRAFVHFKTYDPWCDECGKREEVKGWRIAQSLALGSS